MSSVVCHNSNFRSCYKTWKSRENTLNSVVPGNSYPVIDITNSNVPLKMKNANPIKHWRKQLMPTNGRVTNKVSIDQVLRPGGSVQLKNNNGSSDCSQIMKTYIKSNTNINCCPDDEILNQKQKARRSLSSSTIIRNIHDKTTGGRPYYTSHKAYLQSRVKLYDQRVKVTKTEESSITSPEFRSVYRNQNPNCNENGFVTVIYKPNNSKFKQQGAVSSGLRIAKLNIDTINKNAESFRREWGQLGVNAARYKGNYEAPFFAKNKFENTSHVNSKLNSYRKYSGGVGNHNICPSTGDIACSAAIADLVIIDGSFNSNILTFTITNRGTRDASGYVEPEDQITGGGPFIHQYNIILNLTDNREQWVPSLSENVFGDSSASFLKDGKRYYPKSTVTIHNPRPLRFDLSYNMTSNRIREVRKESYTTAHDVGGLDVGTYFGYYSNKANSSPLKPTESIIYTIDLSGIVSEGIYGVFIDVINAYQNVNRSLNGNTSEKNELNDTDTNNLFVFTVP